MRYREAERVADRNRRDPLVRLRGWLAGTGVLAEGEKAGWTEEINAGIGAAIAEAESLPPPPVESMFADVYAEMPPHIEEQVHYAIAMGEGQKVEGAFPL